MILQGCQSFDQETSVYAKCSEANGIEVYSFDNQYCDGTAAYTSEVFTDGTIECNYGTGRSVWCFDEDTDTNSTDSSDGTGAPGSTMSTEEEDLGPQHCSTGNCGSAGERFKPGFIGFCMAFIMVYFSFKV